ncbi:two component transcriptional regulator, AraC family [Thermosinus carboxydivorans Nor1]|uniref:Two component transcriptional regulator, AraC family n=1 Tax=Thermosinus carboxydivorans Nor1 TaxID=401526 RepID=A1HMP5_9FIRM|nr:response regulator transcription factor [Thermosinus carboxydivorans]EAX48533.1 two component transcriptional regulator, AraC family [Thermosinus carboxydivorans Nor1]
MNVLLVNDDPLELEQQKLLIQSVCPHWRLFTAGNGSAAINLTTTNYFELAFLNINLPAQSDLIVAGKLRQSGRVKDIVIVTAHQDFAIAHAAIKIGAADLLIKPISADELNTILSRYLPPKNTKPVYSPLITKVLTILENRYAERLSLTNIAATVHVNPSYLSRRFKAEVGYSFSQYLINLRLKIAKDLLISRPDLSIAQIAEQTGFASQQYLSALFHRNTGLTPREYRKNNPACRNQHQPYGCSDQPVSS